MAKFFVPMSYEKRFFQSPSKKGLPLLGQTKRCLIRQKGAVAG